MDSKNFFRVKALYRKLGREEENWNNLTESEINDIYDNTLQMIEEEERRLDEKIKNSYQESELEQESLCSCVENLIWFIYYMLIG
jgi:hypothetical protein